MANPIYQPTGKAREYSPYALNIYMGCTHACEYCYAPACMHKTKDAYFAKPAPRAGIVEALRRQLYRERFDEQVLLSFIGDCFCETADNSEAARKCLKLLAESGTPTAILTKGGSRLLLAECEILQFTPGTIAVGATLTFTSHADLAKWEPGAAPTADRLAALRHFHNLGVRTFASFEPVIDPGQSLDLIRQTAEEGIIDTYKIGKLNHHPLASQIDWHEFCVSALDILRNVGADVYVKNDLAAACARDYYAETPFLPFERSPDAHIVRRAY